MKILQIMPSIARSFGGPTESLIGYSQAINKVSDIQLEVASPRCPGKDFKWLSEQLPFVEFHQFKTYGRHAWVSSPELWKWLSDNGRNYDLIHIHGLFNPVSSFSATICRKKQIPYIIRPFGTLSRYTFSRRKWFKQPWYQLIDKPNLRKAEAVHFTTEAEYEVADRLNINFSEKKYVIPPPFKFENDNYAGASEKFDEPVCLFMSRLHPKKNLEDLIQAWEQVVQKYPTSKLLVAGSGEKEYQKSLKSLVAKLDLFDSVTFKGFVTGMQKRELIERAWLFALPSYHENFGIAVLEAIAEGLPVVISPEVQLCNFVKESNTGKVVKRNPKLIANAIIDIIEDKPYRKRCAEEGPVSVKETFSLDRVGQKLIETYHTVT
ncbi:glycosyltransferase [Fodinibius sp. AD559]|uniref:glycosyltransferase n=1 Tax=Fodinibius sp. AD559 TaxID=3424179 RepID=UPI004046FDFC